MQQEYTTMYYQDHLFVDTEHVLKILSTPQFVVRSERDLALDVLYQDVLPLKPIMRLVDDAHMPTSLYTCNPPVLRQHH
jgi:hypothetical protein